MTTRTIQWIPDTGPYPIAGIVGPPGSGSGSGGGIGLPVTYTVTTGGQQSFAFSGLHALVFLGAVWQPPSLFTISGGNLVLSATAGAGSGDVITAYPLT